MEVLRSRGEGSVRGGAMRGTQVGRGGPGEERRIFLSRYPSGQQLPSGGLTRVWRNCLVLSYVRCALPCALASAAWQTREPCQYGMDGRRRQGG